MKVPGESYGILQRTEVANPVEAAVEQVRNLGFAVLDSGYDAEALAEIESEFERVRALYADRHGSERLARCSELHTVRAPLTMGSRPMLDLALNPVLLAAVGQLIPGKFILNQQNGVINPPQETYNQGKWHRDLPYQHFVTSRPIAVNALFCVDAFTCENGGTFVLPASHKSEPFPSSEYVTRNALQVSAPAGSYILLDCMLFHSGGFNRTERERRAVNHVFNIPYFKQQINIPANMDPDGLDDMQRDVLGFRYLEPGSVEEYLASRAGSGY